MSEGYSAVTAHDALFAGIDVSARRGLDLAALTSGLQVADLHHAPSLAALHERLVGYHTQLIVAIDAPQLSSDFPLRRAGVQATLAVPPPAGRYRRYRVCDYELARRGIPLYLLPETGQPAPAWMAVGFEVFALLRQTLNLRAPHDAGDYTATLLEAYPFASFVALLGYVPARKSSPEGQVTRLAALRAAGITGLPAGAMTHDAVDALVAAYTAWAWHAGQGCALGLPAEGMIVLPVPLDRLSTRYRRGRVEVNY